LVDRGALEEVTQDAEKLAETIALRVVEILTARGMLAPWENEGDHVKAGESLDLTDTTESGESGRLVRRAGEAIRAAKRKKPQRNSRRKSAANFPGE
jgi:hypothetical protein